MHAQVYTTPKILILLNVPLEGFSIWSVQVGRNSTHKCRRTWLDTPCAAAVAIV
jgi:hypothetical protein